MDKTGTMSASKPSVQRWDDEVLRKFYRAYHKIGDNWVKVSKQVGTNKSPEECEALYRKFQTFMSIPNQPALENAFVAMVVDHYNNIKETDDASVSEGKSGPQQRSAVKADDEATAKPAEEPSSQRVKRTPKPKTMSDEETKPQPSPNRRPGTGTTPSKNKAAADASLTQPKKRSRKLFGNDGGDDGAVGLLDFRSPVLDRWAAQQHDADVGEGVDALLSLASIAHASSGLAPGGDDNDNEMQGGLGGGQEADGGVDGRSTVSASAAKKKPSSSAQQQQQGSRFGSPSPAGTPRAGQSKGGKSASLKSPGRGTAAGLNRANSGTLRSPRAGAGPSTSAFAGAAATAAAALGSAVAAAAAAEEVGTESLRPGGRSKRKAAAPEAVAANLAGGGAANAALMRGTASSTGLPMAVSSIRTRGTGPRGGATSLGKRGSGGIPKRQGSVGSQQEASQPRSEHETGGGPGAYQHLGFDPSNPLLGMLPFTPQGMMDSGHMMMGGSAAGGRGVGRGGAAAAAAAGRARRRKPAPERMPPMMTPIKLLVARSTGTPSSGMGPGMSSHLHGISSAMPTNSAAPGGPAGPNVPLGEDGQPMGTAERALRHCLSARVRRWAMYEFHYSALDRPWFLRNELADFTRSLGINGVGLTRSEWAIVRGALGKPRRLSLAFLKQERTRLEAYREHVRQVYEELGIGMEVPADLPRPLRVGQEVTARHPVTRQLHDGTILTAKGSKYRVQFHRSELMTEVVRDTDVMPVDPNENLPVTLLANPPPVLNGRSAQGVEASRLRGLLVSRRGVAGSRVTDPQELVRDSDLSMMEDVSRFLTLKEALVQRLKQLNEEASASQGAGTNIVHSEQFQMEYTTVVLQLKDTNDRLELALARLQSRGQQVQQAAASAAAVKAMAAAAAQAAVESAAAVAAAASGLPPAAAPTPGATAGGSNGGAPPSASGSAGGAAPATQVKAEPAGTSGAAAMAPPPLMPGAPAATPLPVSATPMGPSTSAVGGNMSMTGVVATPSTGPAAATLGAPAAAVGGQLPPASVTGAAAQTPLVAAAQPPVGAAADGAASELVQGVMLDAEKLVDGVAQSRVGGEEAGAEASLTLLHGDTQLRTMVNACAGVLLTLQKCTAPGTSGSSSGGGAPPAAAAPAVAPAVAARALEQAAEGLPKPRYESNSDLYRQVMESVQGIKSKLAAAY